MSNDEGIVGGAAILAEHVTGLEAAIEAGKALGNPTPIAPGTYSVLVPAGARHELVRFPVADPDHDDVPERARGTYSPATVESLIDLIDRHRDESATTIWVHPTDGRIVAVFNDAHPSLPAWRDHRAHLQLTRTPEWTHWASRDGRLMSQQEFAEHLEDGITELVAPPAADMLELAQTFHASTSAQFRSAHRLHSGEVQFQYDEEVQAAAGRNGEMKVPTEFELAIAPFIGEAPFRITARLRYRVQGGKLTIGYKLNQPDRAIRTALDEIRARIAGNYTGVFLGDPAAAGA